MSATTPAGNGAGTPIGKIRNPWTVLGLTVVTFGIYQLFWHYMVNDEIRRYSRTVTVSPALAVVALLFPISNIVTAVRTCGRITAVRGEAGVAGRCSGWIWFLCALVFCGGVYQQAKLNEAWRAAA